MSHQTTGTAGNDDLASRRMAGKPVSEDGRLRPAVRPAETAVAHENAASLRYLRLLLRGLQADRYSGIYVLVLLVVVFCVWEPTTFATGSNARILVSGEAVTGVITFAAVVGLVAGVFDLSIAANMSLAISLVGVLQSSYGLNWVLAIVLTLLAGALVGCVNAFVITRLRINMVIATLGTGSILGAASYWVANGQDIVTGISPTFTRIGGSSPLGLPISVYYLLIVAVLLWYVLERTPTGRYLYAAGANPEAARLSGVKVVRLQWGALITSGALSAAAGIILSMQLGASSFGAGNSYLLPAFAGAYLGQTQIRPGRFNILGTIVAMYLVATSVKGLQLRYPQYAWIAALVDGLILLVAVGIAVRSGRGRAADGR